MSEASLGATYPFTPSSICLLAFAPSGTTLVPTRAIPGWAQNTPSFGHPCPGQSPPLAYRKSSPPTSCTFQLPASHWPHQRRPLGLPLGLAESCLLSRPCSSFCLGEPTQLTLPENSVCVVPGFQKREQGQKVERSLFFTWAANAARWVLGLNTHNC